MKRFVYTLGLMVVMVLMSAVDVEAQCAMCRATLENNVSNGDINMAARLNFGILYLFVLPYLLVMIMGFLWYKKSKKNRRLKIEADKRKERISQSL